VLSVQTVRLGNNGWLPEYSLESTIKVCVCPIKAEFCVFDCPPKSEFCGLDSIWANEYVDLGILLPNGDVKSQIFPIVVNGVGNEKKLALKENSKQI
jgi:hypothetical protein